MATPPATSPPSGMVKEKGDPDSAGKGKTAISPDPASFSSPSPLSAAGRSSSTRALEAVSGKEKGGPDSAGKEKAAAYSDPTPASSPRAQVSAMALAISACVAAASSSGSTPGSSPRALSMDLALALPATRSASPRALSEDRLCTSPTPPSFLGKLPTAHELAKLHHTSPRYENDDCSTDGYCEDTLFPNTPCPGSSNRVVSTDSAKLPTPDWLTKLPTPQGLTKLLPSSLRYENEDFSTDGYCVGVVITDSTKLPTPHGHAKLLPPSPRYKDDDWSGDDYCINTLFSSMACPGSTDRVSKCDVMEDDIMFHVPWARKPASVERNRGKYTNKSGKTRVIQRCKSYDVCARSSSQVIHIWEQLKMIRNTGFCPP